MFLSIGCSGSAVPDLTISEQIGCPIHYVPLSTQDVLRWEEVKGILKTRTRNPETVKWSFSEGVEQQWVLPKQVRQVASLPWWAKGQVQLVEGEQPLPANPVLQVVEELCNTMNYKEPGARIDLLKLDCCSVAPGLERALLSAILDAGFRPSLLLIKWSVSPDSDIATTSIAGHLQNTGYHILSKHETKYLYYFNDNDLYQTCSWEGTGPVHPIVQSIVSTLRESRALHSNHIPSTTAGKETSLSSVEEKLPE